MHILVKQRFVDYAQWTQSFARLAGGREEQGLRTVLVGRDRSDPQQVVVLFETDDPEAAARHLHSEELQDSWRDAGVDPESNQVTLIDTDPELSA